MMKQSTLLGAFTVTRRESEKAPELPVDISICDEVLQRGTEITAKKARGSKTALRDAVVQKNGQKTPLTSAGVAEKTPRAGVKKSNKLSLSNRPVETSPVASSLPESISSDVTTNNTEVLAYSDFLAQVTRERKAPSVGLCDPEKDAASKSSPITSDKREEITSKLQSHLLGKKKGSTCSTKSQNLVLDKEKESTASPECKKEETKSKNEKPTMSYSDFLSMFKPAPVVAASTSDLLDVCQTETSAPDLTETVPVPSVQCKSILSFFPKSTSSKSEQKKQQDSGSVTVVAEVHPREGCAKSKIPPSPFKLEGRSKVKPTSDPDEIEFLGSETLQDTEDTTNKSKKRKNEPALSSVEKCKKQKTVEKNCLKDCEDVKSPSPLNVEGSVAKDSIKILTDASQASTKTSQSQLCFGKSGLTLSKPKVEPETEAVITMKDGTPERRKRGRPRKVFDTETGGEGNLAESPGSQDAMKESIISVESYSAKVNSTGTGIDQTTDEITTHETPTLRRSSRISRPVRPLASPEVVEVDDEKDEDCDGKGKRSRKQRNVITQSQAQLEADTGKASPRKKTKGPLAPIFTSMKPKEEMRPPPEDPEKVRLRKEFMMSGIPDELKRQIATTSLSNIALDYPPLPRPSHVQQVSGEICTTNSYTGAIRFGFTCQSEEIEVKDTAWKRLAWDATVVSGSTKKSFESFHCQSELSKSQVKELMTTWQQVDSTFKFEETYSQLLRQLKSPRESGTAGESSSQKMPRSVDDEDVDVVIIDETTPAAQKTSENAVVVDSNACLWSDIHQPDSSAEMIGNTAVLDQLRDWLAEWKKVVQKDVKKASKRAAQPAKAKGKGGWSDDSDFTDSEEEDMRLCNTMLVTGPHGVGKTSAVYALAREMGYKVFEVNSSSLRSGKQILSQLEEATQSHRVAPSKARAQDMATTHTPPPGTTSSKVESKPLPKRSNSSKSMASAFATLFQTPGPQATKKANAAKSDDSKKVESAKKSGKNEKETEPKSRGKKISAVEDYQSKSEKASLPAKKSSKSAVKDDEKVVNKDKSSSGSHNLATTSLILFDEVDVVFEEDKGFLSTVELFMASTKIPIILTSTDVAFSSQLGARHDHIIFKPPSLRSSVSFLCCVCLAHGVPVGQRSLETLLQLLRGDLRRCLLHLQFWCQSGGGRRQGRQDGSPFSSSSVCVTSLCDSKHAQPSSQGEGAAIGVGEKLCNGLWDVSSDDSNSGNQFLCLRPAARRAKRMILDDDEDENSNSSVQSLESQDQQATVSNQSATQIGIIPSCRSGKRKRLSRKKSLEDAASSTDVSRSETEAKPSQKVAATGKKSNDVPGSGGKGEQDPSTNQGLQLHLDLAESVLGVQHATLVSQTVVRFIQSTSLSRSAVEDAIQVVEVVDGALHCSSIYQLVLHSTLVPKCDRVKVRLTLSSRPSQPSQGRKRRRIIEGAWLDSDCSDDEPERNTSNVDSDLVRNAVGVSGCEERQIQSSTSVEGNDKAESASKDSQSVSKNQPSKSKEPGGAEPEKCSNRACLAMLSDMSRYYDSVSLADTFETFYSRTNNDGDVNFSPGVSDEDTSPATATHCFGSGLTAELGGAVNLFSARVLCQHLDTLVKNWPTTAAYAPQNEGQARLESDCDEAGAVSWPDELHLPVGIHTPDLWTLGKKDELKRPRDSATKNVLNCLGPAVLENDPTLHTDYLPCLREICRSEDERRLAKAQRRFHHYLDNCGLALKKSTLACLTSTYKEFELN